MRDNLIAEGCCWSFLMSKRAARWICFLSFVFQVSFLSYSYAQSQIPFVSCTNNGQVGTGPSGKPLIIDAPDDVAKNLALYAGDYQIIIGPRGWVCSGEEGSSMDTLSVRPLGAGASSSGPLISATFWSGDTQSGIAMKLSYAGTYFQTTVSRSDIQSFMSNSGINESLEKFLVPRYSVDKLKYDDSSEFQFESPPGEKTLAGRLITKSNYLNSFGLVKIYNSLNEGGIYFFVERLPMKQLYLKNYILQFARRCVSSNYWKTCAAFASYNSTEN